MPIAVHIPRHRPARKEPKLMVEVYHIGGIEGPNEVLPYIVYRSRFYANGTERIRIEGRYATLEEAIAYSKELEAR